MGEMETIWIPFLRAMETNSKNFGLLSHTEVYNGLRAFPLSKPTKIYYDLELDIDASQKNPRYRYDLELDYNENRNLCRYFYFG